MGQFGFLLVPVGGGWIPACSPQHVFMDKLEASGGYPIRHVPTVSVVVSLVDMCAGEVGRTPQEGNVRLRSGCGSVGNVYNVFRGLRDFWGPSGA